jgi:hypothetical protein
MLPIIISSIVLSDAIIKRAFEILETSEDYREKLQAMELLKETHIVKLELLSNISEISNRKVSNKRNSYH